MPQSKAAPLTQPQRFRWLVRGERYVYSPKQGKGDDSRRGQSCTVVTLPRPGGGPGNVRVLFGDGYEAIVPSGVLRKG